MNTATQSRDPLAITPHAPTNLPVHEYQQRLAVERPKVWRGIVALVLLFLGTLVFSGVFTMLGMAVDTALTGGVRTDVFTPALLAGAMLGLAALTPWSMLLQKWFFKVPMASLHSIVSRFRWDIFGRTVAIVIPVGALLQIVYPLLMLQPTATYPMGDLLAFFVLSLTLVPLQAMGEEYAFRGLAFRIAASWGRGPRAALVIGIAVSSSLFMVAHLALDPWLNLYYFVFGAALCVITWRTGGLEAAVVLHAANNALAFIVTVVLRQDLAAGLDRSAGAASAVMLIPCALLLAVAALVWWRTPRAAQSRPASQRPLPEGHRPE